MALDPDEPLARKPAPGLLPADLSRHSVAELEALIETLEGEILRCREALKAKHSTRTAAESIFNKK